MENKKTEQQNEFLSKLNLSSGMINSIKKNEYNRHVRSTIIEFKGEKYHYDISDLTKFSSLKKMIQASLKIRRSLINFYNIKDEKLEDFENVRIFEMFPEEKVIYLKIKLSPSEAILNSSRRKIYLDNYCNLHARKYLGLYCFSCKKSFCVNCLEENLHKGHNYIEKYDYLQNSKFLVDESFKKISQTIYSTEFSLEEKCEDLLNKNDKYFDSVIELFKAMKLRARTFILNYAEKSKTSYNNLKINLEIIKDTCTESLEELKERLIMENIVCCEETFLEFDNKYKSLKEEENAIEIEKANFEDISNFFNIFSNSINNFDEEMKSFILKKNHDFYQVLDLKTIEDRVINQISEIKISNIRSKILENVSEGYFKNPKSKKSIFDKINHDGSNNSILNNSNITESYCADKNHKISKNIIPIVKNNNFMIPNIHSNENSNPINNINSRETNINKDNENLNFSTNFEYAPTYNQFELKNDANQNIFPLKNIQTTEKNNLNNTLKQNDHSSSIFNNLSPIQNKDNQQPLKSSNVLNKDCQNRTEIEESENKLQSNEDNNCWKMTYNTGNRNRIRSSFLNDNKNSSMISGPSKINFDTKLDNAAYPSFNIHENNNESNNGANSEIITFNNLNENRLEIDVKIKYPSLDVEQNNNLQNLETSNNEKEKRIFTQIPVKFKEETPPTNMIEPKSDKLDTNIIEINSIDNSKASDRNILNEDKEKENLDSTNKTYLNFYENVLKISNDLQSGLNKIENQSNLNKTEIFCNVSESKKEGQKCNCSNDLFDMNKKYHIFVAPVPNTNQIKIYHENLLPKEESKSIISENEETNEVNCEICDLYLDFPNHNIFSKKSYKNTKSNNLNSTEHIREMESNTTFFNNAAFVNKVIENDIFRKLFLYCSGGTYPKSDCDSSRFFYLEFQERRINYLPDMLEARSHHSMLEHQKIIFVVGGKDKNTCEKFDLNKKEWIKMPNLKSGERRNPGLIVYKDFLYAFFGWNRTGCLDSIERIGLLSPKAQWYTFSYKRMEKLNLGMYGFAFFPNKIKSNEIFLLGGRNNSETLDTILKFDFNDNQFSITDMKLKRKSFFIENQLAKLCYDYYGHFDSEQFENILRIN